MEQITLTVTELKYIIKEAIAEDKINKLLSRPQLTFKEACDEYGQSRVKDWISAKLLKPVSQNGRGSKVYYSHKKIIQLSEQSRTNLKRLSNEILKKTDQAVKISL